MAAAYGAVEDAAQPVEAREVRVNPFAEAPEDQPDPPWKIDGATICCLALVAFILLIPVIILIGEGIAWHRVSLCSSETTSADWGVIPATTSSQRQIFAWSNLFYQDVDVFNPIKSNDTRIGYWTDADMFFGLMKNFAYTSVSRYGETLLIRARKPWGLYLGRRYELWRCGQPGPEYLVQEDWFGRGWNPFNPQFTYNIIEANSGRTIAISNHTISNIWTFGDAHWHIDIGSPGGIQVASLDQESFNVKSSIFSVPRWYTLNMHPEIVPSEVASFIAAVTDIENAKKSSKSSSGGRKGGKR